ncbi:MULTISPECIES: NAD(P)/FAD-dependent oxidoreductase [unclassified Saccharothrix]|uniref:NAD(P)/FAD-dependent oxidoreductase n=1 Tax=unclassified Saccharothrix TaxID=2593673 RepID=UPI00307D7AC4
MSGAPGSVVVVGAGLAGVTTAEYLRAHGYDGRLTLIGAEDEPPYDRPPLSKDVLTGKSALDEVRLHPEGWYADRQVGLRLGVAAQEIRPAERAVVLADGTVERADAVVLATGGTARRLSVPGAEHPSLLTLRTARDAVRLRERLVPGTRVAVVGAGLIGAEVTASAVALGCEVTLLDPVTPPLVGVVGPEIARVLHAQHEQHGVDLRRGSVGRVESTGSGVRLHIGDGVVDCDVVVVGIGIELNLDLAHSAGLAVDGGVLVDNAGRTSNPAVFAAGDVARRVGAPREEHWDAALREGEAAAAGVLGQPAPAAKAPWFWSDRYDTHLEGVGSFTTADRTVVRGELTADFTAIALRGGGLVGAVAVNRPQEIKALRRLLDRNVPVDAAMLADESVDLRRLARGV